MISSNRLIALTAFYLSLSACGVGGGSSVTPSSVFPSNGGWSNGGETGTPQSNFNGFANTPDGGYETLDAQTVEATYSLNRNSREVNYLNVVTANDSAATFLNENGKVTAFRVDGKTKSFDFARADGDQFTDEGAAVSASSTDLYDFGVVMTPQASGYEYQTFGSWITGYGRGTGSTGSGSFGLRTQADAVPQNQTASYRGQSSGVARRADGQAYITASRVTVNTDFSSVDIASTGTRGVNVNTGAVANTPELDFTGSGQVLGAEFKADIAGSGTSGTANGRFYGPKADEVGGTFHTTGSGIDHVGSFGGS